MHAIRPSLLLTGLVLAACGGSSATTTTEPIVTTPGTATIGATGGTVSLGSVTVQIPAGALARDNQIAITRTKDTPPEGARSSVFRFDPEGTTFAIPATVRFPVVDGTQAASVVIYWTKLGSQDQWETLPVTVEGNFASAQVTHFSKGFVGPPCNAGTACVPEIACHAGITACSPTPVCQDTWINRPDGASCGPTQYSLCTAGHCNFNGNTCTDFSVAARIAHSASPGPIAIADFDGNGHLDLAVVSTWAATEGPADSITLYYGDATGTAFSLGPTAATGSYPSSVELALGFPGPGPNLLVTNAQELAKTLSIFSPSLQRTDYGNPKAADNQALTLLQPGFSVGATTVPPGVHLVELTWYGGYLSNRFLPDVLDSTLGPPGGRGELTTTCEFGGQMVSGDFDGDGFADVLVACPHENAVRMHLFPSTSATTAQAVGYGSGRVIATPASPGALAVGDGGRFFVTSNQGDDSVSVFTRDPTLGPLGFSRTDYPVPHQPGGLLVADVNHDGYLDLVVSTWYGLSFFFGDSSSNVPRSPRLDIDFLGVYGGTIRAADLDADGYLELVTQAPLNCGKGCFGGNQVLVLHGDCGASP